MTTHTPPPAIIVRTPGLREENTAVTDVEWAVMHAQSLIGQGQQFVAEGLRILEEIRADMAATTRGRGDERPR